MNTDERRALALLREEGVEVTDEAFNHWCMGKKAYYSSSAGCLWHPKPKEIVTEWKSENLGGENNAK